MPKILKEDRVYISKYPQTTRITSGCEFFERVTEVVVEAKYNRCIIRECEIDDNLRTLMHNQINCISKQLSTRKLNISSGEYLIDTDESNEDQIVFYYEDMVTPENG